MKRTFNPPNQKLIIGLFILLFVQNCYATLKPVAEAVRQKHDLNIAFRTYDLFKNVHEPTDENIKQALSSGTSADIIPGKLFVLVQEAQAAITLNIPFNGRTLSIELVRVNIFTEDFSVITNENKVVAYTPGVYYRGTIKGNPNSLAAFSFFNDELFGIVSDYTNGNIVVGRVIRPGNTSEYIIYSDRNLLHPLSNYCNTADNTSNALRMQGVSQQPLSTSTVNCARLYYEVDNNIFRFNNSNIINTTNWITAVHNNVATLYANDNISVAFSQVFIWTTPDPFIGADSNEQLALFHTNRTSFNGDVGQLVAKDNGFTGLADTVNGLCSTSNYSYSDVDFDFLTVPVFSWTIETITHEFGHLLGSQHTHNCSWPGGAIDNCGPMAGFPTEGGCPPGPSPVNGGTIMSFCHLVPAGINFNNGFGPLPAAAIQNAINNALCLGTTCATCPVPAHNSCSTPASLNVNSNCIYTSGNLCGATESITAINCNGRQATHAYDVWYTFIPTQTDLIAKCQSGTATDVVFALYSGTCGSLSLISCSDATLTGGLETITATVTIGSTYYIRVYDFNGNSAGMDFGICLMHSCLTVTNNECATALPLSMNTVCNYINGDLCSATQSMAPEDCSGFPSTNALDLFYKITPPQSNVVITCQSGGTTDIVLSIYSGTCDSLNFLQCNDTTSSGGIEIINTSLTPGNTYYIRVYDWNGNVNGSDFKLCAKYIPCTPLAAPTGASATFNTICSGSTTTLNVSGTLAAGANWHWYSGSCGGTALGTGSFIVVSPSSNTTYYVRAENGTCYSTCRNVIINVTSTPSAPSFANASNASICSAASSTLSVTGTLSAGASWHWYSASCGATPEGIGVSISVTPSSTTSYFVRAENGSCYSVCVNTIISVATTPNDPVSASGNSPVCAGANSTLQVNGALSAGATWHWYTGSCGGSAADTGSSIVVSPSSTTTYFVRAENGGCFSNCSSVIVNVNLTPAAPASANASPASLCSAASSTLTVTGSLSVGAIWHWYSASCGGTQEGTGVSISVSPSSTTNYFIRAENGTCFSNCVNIIVSVAATPNNPVSASGNSPVCAGSNSILQVNGTLSAGASWHWYIGSCGGAAIGTSSTIIVSPTSNTTYYVRAENGACYSNCSSATINVNPTPSAPSSANASPSFLCSAGTSSTLTVTGTLSAGATWHWYSASCGGTPAGTGVSISVSPTSTTNYFVRAENGTCFSSCVNAIVSVATTPNNPVSASGTSPICSGINSTLQVNGTLSAGATWHWYIGSCGGTATGTGSSIIVSPSSISTYYVRAENGGCFSNCSSVIVNVNPIPSAPSSANASPSFLCSAGASSTLTVTGTLSAGATWHWYSGSCGGTPAGTGVSISVSPTSTTNYFIRAENGTCSSACVNAIVSVASVPNDPLSVSGSSTICSGINLTLHVNGTLSAGATWHWYAGSCGGAVIDTGSSVIVSPTSNATYFVRAENGVCYSNCRSIMINVNPTPSAPSSSNASPASLCSAGSSTLAVTGTLSAGATWHWYSDSCGGTPEGTGVSVSVSPSSTTNYFVRAENGTCFSNCVNTIVSVASTPNDPVTASGNSPVCAGSNSMLHVNGPLSAGATWHWYTDSCGGTAIDTGSSIIVSPASTSTFYVRAEEGSCFSNCVNISVNVLPTPADPQTINSSSTILCERDSAILSEIGIPSAGSDWYWYADSCGGTPAGQGTSIVVSPIANETYYVRAEDANCQSNCSSKTIIVNPLPSQPVINVNNDTLSVSSYPAYQWYWSIDRATFDLLGNAQQQKATNARYYFVVVTDINGCTASSDTILYQAPDFVSEKNLDDVLSVYPNPANDLLNIKLKSAMKENAGLKIFDDTGRLIYSCKIIGGKTNIISLAPYADGIYQLLFSIEGRIFIRKVLKQ